MPDRQKCTPPSEQPYPHGNPDEIAAQRMVRWCLIRLRQIAICLRGVHASLPDPLDAEDMGEGRIPESLSFSIRGTVECVLADDLEPAIASLEEVWRLTPEDLLDAWEAKQAEKEGRP